MRTRKSGRRSARAERVVMCDTNGGMLPSRITAAVTELMARLDITGDQLGIHCQNDTSCAVANTVAAVEAGVTPFQCANGYGERPGNADLFAVLGNLQLKLGLPVLPEGCLDQMVRVSHAVAEVANIAPDTRQAYVGAAAFAHKAGLHASAIKLDPALYNHVDPATVDIPTNVLFPNATGANRRLSRDPHRVARLASTTVTQLVYGWAEGADGGAP